MGTMLPASCPVFRLFFLVVLLPFLVKGQDSEPEVGAVKVELMIGPGLSVAGGGMMAWDLYSFPDFSSTGTGVFKSRFLETDPNLPVRHGGYALLEWKGSNSADLLFRDLDLKYKSIQFDPFFSTTFGLIYSATPEEETQRWIFEDAGSVIWPDGGLVVASDDGTIVFNDFLEGNVPNISVITEDGAKPLVTMGDPVPNLNGVTFKGLQRVHVSPTGGVAFASSLEGTGVDFTNDWGLFRQKSTGVLELMVREGDPHPEDPRLRAGGVFIDFATHQTGFGFNGSGAAAFTALITNPDAEASSASNSLWYVQPDSQAPTLVAVSGLPMETESEGTITFNRFVYSADGAKIPPMVDFSGDIIFFAELLDGLTVSRPAIWRWNGGTVSKIIDLDRLPLEGVENKTVTISDVCLSSRGRIAMIGVVDGLAQVIWAQDDQGRFANVITRDPVDSGVYSNENLILNVDEDETSDLGKVSRLGTLAGVFNDASGGEDGLMSPWWTPEEKLMFSVEVQGGDITTPYICQATIGKGIEIPKGVTYIWDEGLGGIDWHEIEAGKTNWVDTHKVRWDKPPTRSNAEVFIPKGFFVELHQSVDEIASLDSKGDLEMFASLKVREMTSLGDITIRGDNDLISNGEVIVDGEVLAGNNGVHVDSSVDDTSVLTKGKITGEGGGIFVEAANGTILDNEANVSSISRPAISVSSETGNIQIQNRGVITSNNNSGIWTSSTTGSITVLSPSDGNSLTTIGATGSGIKATTAGPVIVNFNGEMDTVASGTTNSDRSIFAESSGSNVSVTSKGTLSGTSLAGGGGGILARGLQDVLAKHEGVMLLDSSAIVGESTEGNVVVDARETFIAANFGTGLMATAPNGKATVFLSGEMAVGQGSGIIADAGGDVVVESNAVIQTISGSSANSPAPGISANSTSGSISITHSGEISTTHTRESPAIIATASSDVTVNSDGNLSTLNGKVIALQSTNGNVDLKHKGPIAATGEGGGIFAKSNSGWVSVFSDDSEGLLGSNGDFNGSDGIHLEAKESVTLFWSGDILTLGNMPDAISATSETAGVSVTTKGDVTAGGNMGRGIVLSGPSILTVNVLGGSVTGADSPTFAAGIGLLGGTENKVKNHGSISSFGFVAIRADTGNDTIDNHGQIYGSIDLGTGTNVIENRSGALLVTHNDLKVGEGNFLNNHGHLQIGELGEETLTTTMVGNLFLEASSSYRMEIEDTTIAGEPITDHLIVSGSAAINGELIISIQELYDEPKAGDTFTILTADSISGTFFYTRVLNSSKRFAETSRTVGVELSYTDTMVTGTVVLLEVNDYDSWKDVAFDDEEKADESVSGPDANPDGDGLSNGDESLFGGDPTKPDGSPVSFDLGDVDAVDGIQISATFNVADDITDREWLFETSTNLNDWTEAAVSETTVQDMGDFSKLTVAFDQPVQSNGSTFVRLKSRAVSP